MPILTFDSLEKVPEGLQGATKEVKDGDKVTYQVNVVSSDKIDEFRNRNVEQAKQLEAEQALTKKFKAISGMKPEEFDPDKFAESLTELRKTAQLVSDGKLKASDDIEKVVNERTETMREKHDRELQTKQQEIAAVKNEVAEYKGRLQRTFIDRAVVDAIRDEELGVASTAHHDIISRAYGVFQVAEDGALTPQRNGQTLWGEDGSTPMTMKEWIDITLRKEAPHYFKKSTGGNANGGDGNGKAYGGMAEADFLKLPPEQRLKLINRQQTQARR